MITASFKSNAELFEVSLNVKGHAGQAEYGKDIVCSAASILAYTFAQVIESLGHRLEGEPTINLEDGNTTIACRCANYRTYVKALHALNYTEVGYSLLAQSYPQYVEIQPFGEPSEA